MAAIPSDSREHFRNTAPRFLNRELLCRATGHTIALAAKLVSGFTVRWLGASSIPGKGFTLQTIPVIWMQSSCGLVCRRNCVKSPDRWLRLIGKFSVSCRFLARSFNAILIDRKQIKVHQSPVDVMMREIGDIYSLIVFPEGAGEPRMERLGEFKSGLYYLAKKRPDLQLIPVYMDNLNRILPAW